MARFGSIWSKLILRLNTGEELIIPPKTTEREYANALVKKEYLRRDGNKFTLLRRIPEMKITDFMVSVFPNNEKYIRSGSQRKVIHTNVDKYIW